MTLEDLLRMKVKGINSVSKEEVAFSPDFRIAVQSDSVMYAGRSAVHIIVHAQDHNSDTLDFAVVGNELHDISSTVINHG